SWSVVRLTRALRIGSPLAAATTRPRMAEVPDSADGAARAARSRGACACRPGAIAIVSPIAQQARAARRMIIDTERALRSRSYMTRAVDCRGRPSGRPAAGPEGPALRTE